MIKQFGFNKLSFTITTFGFGFGFGSSVAAWSPVNLFANAEQGVWLDPSDLSTLKQDAAGTIAVTTAGDPIGKVTDKSGNNTAVTQSVSAARMIYSATPSRLTLDKVDDALVIAVPTGGYVGSMTIASTTGTATYGVNIPAGNFTLGGSYFPSNNIVGAVIRAGVLTADEQTTVENHFIEKGAVKSFVGVTSVYMYWTQWSHITSFPLIDTTNVPNFSYAWYSCTGLTSFPAIDTVSGTDFSYAWYSCSKLTSFPLINTAVGTNFSYAWYNCAGLTGFPLINTALVTNFTYAWLGCSGLTAFPAINTSSGTNFANTWRDCTALADFPANMFDSVKGGDFTNAFVNTALTQVSIDNILTSLVTSGIATGTRAFNQSGGFAPSITGTNAIDTLRLRGWTVTVTGAY